MNSSSRSMVFAEADSSGVSPLGTGMEPKSAHIRCFHLNPTG